MLSLSHRFHSRVRRGATRAETSKRCEICGHVDFSENYSDSPIFAESRNAEKPAPRRAYETPPRLLRDGSVVLRPRDDSRLGAWLSGDSAPASASSGNAVLRGERRCKIDVSDLHRIFGVGLAYRRVRILQRVRRLFDRCGIRFRGSAEVVIHI